MLVIKHPVSEITSTEGFLITAEGEVGNVQCVPELKVRINWYRKNLHFPVGVYVREKEV